MYICTYLRATMDVEKIYIKLRNGNNLNVENAVFKMKVFLSHIAGGIRKCTYVYNIVFLKIRVSWRKTSNSITVGDKPISSKLFRPKVLFFVQRFRLKVDRTTNIIITRFEFPVFINFYTVWTSAIRLEINGAYK